MNNSLNRRKLVVFDLDGTLLDSNRDIATALNYSMTTIGGLRPEDIDQRRVAALMGKGLEEVFENFLPDRRDLYPAMVAAYRDYYSLNMTTTTHLFPGMLPILATLKELGRITAIATTKWQTTADKLADYFGLRPYVDFVQATDREGFPLKPDPFILQLLMEKAHMTPADTIMIGDTDNDILCAQRAGVASVGVIWGAWSEENLLKLSPDAIVSTPEHLQALLLPETQQYKTLN
ncbi:MAG: HAD family hydrolase [Chloroflexi bacterium]|uniref:HAD family hydrolase n=1 Tax=Candidatus Chlorohelix allophototropha TaxID=3003348 RepID=A0A8T7LYN0_9CHLR|nr:HAD family hydrolase [Chloroflexota bacterium]WJW67305.1 HAD family hydrolase [Chloroflexota bacterium L227-S17]